MEEVIRQTSRRMSEIFPFSRVLYIDGHFLPYYGGTKVLGNYSSQRRLVAAGREYFWVHDENGMPVYAVSCQDWLPNLAKFSFTNPASYNARKCLIRLHPAPFIRTRLHASDEGSSRYRSAESITFSFLTVALTIER